MKKLQVLFVLLTLIQSNYLLAQETATGRITGVVLDQQSGETLIGVPVILEGTSIGTVTDLDGRYLLNKVPVGTWNLLVKYVGYESKLVKGCNVKANETLKIDFVLNTSRTDLNEVVVVAEMKRENTGSLLLMQKKSATLQDGISAESIRRTPDKSTSEVVRRVPGASIQEGKYVIIRGLNDRYNGAMLNGSLLASTEPDRKAFSFDIFPATLSIT